MNQNVLLNLFKCRGERMKFKPQLAPNDLLSKENADLLNGDDYFVQLKVDGLRSTVIDGEIKTRSMKSWPNKGIDERMKALREMSISTNLYIDGEFDSESTTFNDLSGIFRSFDKPLPDDLVFKIFDIYDPCHPNLEALDRWYSASSLFIENCLPMLNLEWPKSFDELFEEALTDGYEGLMVKRKDAPYKLGRGTYKQGIIYKMKPYETFDCVVTGFEQATVVREGAEKTINELGRSVTSKKKADRVPIESCSALWVDFFGKPLKVSLASLKHPERVEVWKDRDQLLNKYVEFKGMMIGAKDLPRHPMYIRWREDKDA